MDWIGKFVDFFLTLATQNPLWAVIGLLALHGAWAELKWDRSRIKVHTLYKEIAELKESKKELEDQCNATIKAVQERHIGDLQSIAKTVEQMTATVNALGEFIRGTVVPLLFQGRGP
jgi:hypothetical protein